MLKHLLYAPILAQVIVTRRCNLTCTYCNEFDTVSPPVALATLKRRTDLLRALGTWEIEYTGGEPMLHPEICDVIAYARSLKFHQVAMISNAYLFNEERIEQLNEAGLTDLQVSVDGVTPNAVTVKVLKPLRKKLEVLARVAKFRVTLSGVVGATAPGEVLEVIAFAKANGFRPRVLLIHGPDGQLQLGPEELATYRTVRAALGEKFSEAKDYRTRLAETGAAPFKCRSGSRYLYVDEFGVVRWCSQTTDTFGIPLEEYGFAELKQQFYTRKDCAPHCTVGCARTCSRHDEWRAQPDTLDPAHVPAGPARPATAPTAEPLVQLSSRRAGCDAGTP